MKKIVNFTLVLALCLFNTITIKAKEEGTDANPYLKIGIFYGSNAVPTTNLSNVDGSGYGFGFYDSTNTFIKVFDTAVKEITTMKNKNIYLATDNLYYDTKLSSTKSVIGQYTIQLPNEYPSQADAVKTVSSIADAYASYINGKYYVRVSSYETKDLAQTALNKLNISGAFIVEPSENTFIVTQTKTNKILFAYNHGASFGVKPNGNTTWNKGYKYYGGFSYTRQTGNDITVVNVVDMQSYLKGVIPYEMSASWEIEALKAQALTARSYAYNNINKHSKYGFDLCNATDCQVYKGTSSANANSDKAVDDTFAEFITHNGKIATGFFYSSNGGASENSENVWSTKVDYLRGKVDPYEDTENISNGVWTQKITNDQITSILKTKGYNISAVTNMYISSFTALNNVATLTVVDNTGKTFNFSKENARTILNSTTEGVSVKSIRYNINALVSQGSGNNQNPGDNENGGSVYINGGEYQTNSGFYIAGSSGVKNKGDLAGNTVITANGTNTITTTTSKITPLSTSNEYTINGRGWGHNVGMSQYGARAMAKKGFTYDEIVKFYYTGVEVSTR